jgi:hypothetical protein
MYSVWTLLTYQTNNKQGKPHTLVISKNILHSGVKYPIIGNIIKPSDQNIKYPMPIQERYFSVVNSMSRGKVEELFSPAAKVFKT